MAGKYFKTYLTDRKLEAFEQALADTGSSAYAYIAEAVKTKLEAEGYLKVGRITPAAEISREREEPLGTASVDTARVRRRRRRA